MYDEQVLSALKRILSRSLFGEEATKGKEFYIPMNIDSKTQMWGIYLSDLRFFVPVIILVGFLFFLRVNWIIQLSLDFLLFFSVLFLIMIRPLRRDLPAWKIFIWYFQFDQRQKRFFYRKKGVN
ncbi:hypothetical protein BIV60_11995 [Bacillus sp. MUM 116]|uniref:hypothetical protein n=1 Tax=Bacillus sp. MUM 116 TaxID=1678002 RepID=UPI0008F5966B|nr:hypothetical protein [Bacillus sp. MUM 116]OIK14224.1 hypothetical protein BIV60_11995 [Bacillus sp. MUM 116]